MKKITTILAIIITTVLFTSCSENFGNGERIGTITQFSNRGLIWKSYEGHLNVTQTGMNSSTGFDFSIDNDNQNDSVVALLDSAANKGWKVKLVYHQVKGWNLFSNRGNTDYFINSVTVLDRNFDKPFGDVTQHNSGKVLDTIYIVITPSDPNYLKFFNKKQNKQDTTLTVYTGE